MMSVKVRVQLWQSLVLVSQRNTKIYQSWVLPKFDGLRRSFGCHGLSRGSLSRIYVVLKGLEDGDQIKLGLH